MMGYMLHSLGEVRRNLTRACIPLKYVNLPLENVDPFEPHEDKINAAGCRFSIMNGKLKLDCCLNGNGKALKDMLH